MEQQLPAKFEQILNESSPFSFNPSLQTLSVARALIVNPSTSDATITFLFETLTNSLHQNLHDPLSLRHTLSLLSDLATRRPHLSHSIFHAIRSFSLSNESSPRTLAGAISALLSIAELDSTLVSALCEFSEGLFLTLCFRPSVSVRQWLLSNAVRLRIRPHLLLTVLLGFTKDPYPYVRRVALDGLVGLSKSIVVEDRDLVEACYWRAVELQNDVEDSVRSASVPAVARWGKLLVAFNHDNMKKEQTDALFIQLCSVVRDMNVKVRVEAFDALGEMDMVSEDILLQTLSKKVLPIMKEKTYPVLCSTKSFEILASDAAGAFVHGLEDEFSEVRKSACHSLQTLSILSVNFAVGALNLVIEVLNDDSMVVRLQALETMRCMALFNHLNLQQTHMHMFLSTLVDSNSLVRTAARKVIRVAKVKDMAIFRICIDGLLENLEMHPQDEADILSVIFSLGRCHGTFAVKVIEGVLDEIEPLADGKLGFDCGRTAAFLVLAISAPLFHEQHRCSIPPRIFSYAVTMLGRISHALTDVMDQDTLLAYLSHCSSSDVITAVDFRVEDYDDVMKTVELIFEWMNDIWKLIQSGCFHEVLNALSSWKEELATFTTDSSSCVLAFTRQYLKVVKMLAKIWPHFLSPRKLSSSRMGDLSLQLEKLDWILKEMRYRFIGLSKQEELHVLELLLLNSVLRLSSIEAYCESTTLKRLCTTLSLVELLHKELAIGPSNFVAELKKSLDEIDVSADAPFYNPFLFRQLLDSFSLKQLVLCRKFKHIKGEVDVHNNDFENPLHFISGLPAGIPLEIRLYNVSRENRLWLRLVVDEALTEFVFIELDRFGGSNQIRKFTFVAPFYKTPRASSFTVRIYLGMECSSEDDIHSCKGRYGPKRELAYLCKEKEVFLLMDVK